MKRFVLLGGIVTLSLCAAESALADYQNDDPWCTSVNDAFCIDTNNDPGSIPAGNPLVPVTSQLPIQGIIAASPGSNPAGNSYVFFDGDRSNPGPLAGYIGLDAKQSNLVASDHGNFDRADNPPNQSFANFLTGMLTGGAPALPTLPQIPGGVGLPSGLSSLPALPTGGLPTGLPTLPTSLPLP